MTLFVDHASNIEFYGKLIVEPKGWLRMVIDEQDIEYRVAELKMDKYGTYWIKAMDCCNEEFNCRETPFKQFLYFADYSEDKTKQL